MGDFLPSDYKAPAQSNYLKFADGDNTFRILSAAVVGMEFWKTEVVDGKEVRRPVRKHQGEQVDISELEVNKSTGDLDMPKHFWAFVVLNKGTGDIQVLEITQKGIQKAIRALVESPKWGDPKTYDITVTKTGKGMDTEYSVMPNPKEALEDGVMETYKGMNIKLEALFDGKDPFDQASKVSKMVDEVDTALEAKKHFK